jgi:hypothetical protein
VIGKEKEKTKKKTPGKKADIETFVLHDPAVHQALPFLRRGEGAEAGMKSQR